MFVRVRLKALVCRDSETVAKHSIVASIDAANELGEEAVDSVKKSIKEGVSGAKEIMDELSK